MSAHHRQRIREALAALLQPVAPTGTNRTGPLQREELPCIVVYSRSERIDELGNARRQMRTLDIVVDGYVEQVGGQVIDDALDALAVRIEQALAADRKLGGLADKVSLTHTALDLLSEGAVRVGMVRMTFAVLYQTPFGAPRV